MALPSYQNQKSVNKEISTYLLAPSCSLVNPSQDYLELAQYLSNLEFIKFEKSYFIICGNESDHLDFSNMLNPYCENRIEIQDDFNEDCDDMICEDCGRYILPNTYQKQRFLILYSKLNVVNMTDWFENYLANLNITWNKVTAGVYYIFCQKSCISLIIPDFCYDESYLTIDRLKVQPTVLITFKNKKLKLPFELTAVPMADLVFHHQNLLEVLLGAVEKGIPELIPNILFQTYVPLQQIKPAPSEKILQLQIKESAIYINGIEVINNQSKLSISIFLILLEQFFHEFKEGSEPRVLNINQIANSLENITDVEQQVRRPINRMQKIMAEKLAKTLGLNVKRDDVIQTLPWSGVGIKEYGYRLNPFTLTLKK